jgi:hypothetical protein
MSHYAKYNLSAHALHVAADGFHTSAFLAEACVFAYLGLDFVLADWCAPATLFKIKGTTSKYGVDLV